MPKAIIFDLDNTLVTTSGSRRQAWASVVAAFAAKLEGKDQQTVLEVLVDTGDAFWAKTTRTEEDTARKEIIRRSLEQLEISDASLETDLLDAFVERRQQLISLFPGSDATLVALRSAGVRLALLTNSTAGVEAQRDKIERFALAEHFEHIQIEGEFGVGKPDPSTFLNVLDVLALQPSDVWMVGDHLEFDVAAAQRLGICGIWHDHEGSGLPDDQEIRPDHIITAIPALLALVGVKL
jgi:putative hydrolase of the HAD superfamily